MTTVEDIIASVGRLEQASAQARAWMEKGGACCSPSRHVNGYCSNPNCIARAIRYSAMWARDAAHEAIFLSSVAGNVK